MFPLSADFRYGHGHDSLLSDRQEGHLHRLNARMWTQPPLHGNDQSAVPKWPTYRTPCNLTFVFIVKEIIDVIWMNLFFVLKMHQNKTADVIIFHKICKSVSLTSQKKCHRY